ncbi:hypothetical protein [Rheinheimera sp. NSM]|uniref:hypothetical protein n=1 Tax=Rheinheimera sp. NSM TaxID=3457884 RepID=UPI004036AABB
MTHMKNDIMQDVDNTPDLFYRKFGMPPLFTVQGSEHTAHSIFDLPLQHNALEIDDTAMAVFLRLGFFLGSDTPFRQIRVQQPAEQEALLHQQVQEYQGSFDDAAREYGEVFKRAMADYLSTVEQDKIVMPLSGGRDSRHILFAILASGRKVDHCITCVRPPPYDDQDIKVAQHLCQQLNIRHQSLALEPHYLAQQLENFRMSSFCAEENAWISVVADHLNSLDSSYVAFDGLAGGILSDGAFTSAKKIQLYREEKWQELANIILSAEGYLPAMLSEHDYRRWSRDKALDRVIAELKRYQQCPNPVGQFYLWNRTRREICYMPFGYMNKVVNVATPYMFRDVYNFLLQLPGKFFANDSFHSRAIALTYPQYAHLPYAERTPARPLGLRQRIGTLTEIGRFLQQHPHPVSGGFIYPRLAAGIVSGNYACRVTDIMATPVYLAELQRFIRTGQRS